jgi:glucosylceramidase
MGKNSCLMLWFTFVITPLFSQVQWTVTTEKAPWQTNTAPALQKYDGTTQNLIEVYPSKKLQQIDGFGGCFNEKGMDAMAALSKGKQQEILGELFDKTKGCAFNICRMPMGANDYSMDYYSYDDTPEDYEMKHFSIDRDRKYLLPYIKMAMKYNPDLKIWASPWCPPQWMKSSGFYGFQKNEDSSHIRKESKVFKAYALYFEKFVKAYRNEGVNLYAVHVQNEPYSSQIFPSCLWTGAEMRDFIRDYLGPKLFGLGVEIWLRTINSGNYAQSAGAVLTDPKAAKYITGMGFQWDGKKAIAEAAAKHPGFKLMQTESECGGSENNLNLALYTYGLIDHYLKAGAN